MNNGTALVSANGSSGGGSTNTGTGSKEKEPFKVRAELFAPTRLTPSAYAVFRTRALVVDVLAHECLLLVLLAAKTALRARAGVDGATASPQLPRVGILGGGHVGSAVAVALLAHGYPSERLAISTRQPERVPKCSALQTPQALALYHTVPKYYDNARLGRESDVLVLCMPPSQLKSVAIQIKHALSVSDAPTLVVSVLCGAPLEQLQKACGVRGKLVARAKVHVAALAAAAAPDDHVRESSDDRDEAYSSSSIAGNVGGVGHSTVVLAAQELAREQQDVEHLAHVFTELGQRAAAATQDASAVVLGDSAPHETAARELLGLADTTATNGSRGGRASVAACWRADWDDVLAHVQRAAVTRSIAAGGSGSGSGNAMA